MWVFFTFCESWNKKNHAIYVHHWRTYCIDSMLELWKKTAVNWKKGKGNISI